MTKPLTFKEYQEEALKTAVYPNKGDNLYYPCLGLGGETGEVLEKMKKIMRDKDGKIDDQDRDAIKKELGDIGWYLNALASEIGVTLEDVFASNLEKLLSRQKRGTLKGSGDDR